MPKYIVFMRRTFEATVEIEADNEAAAKVHAFAKPKLTDWQVVNESTEAVEAF